MLSLLFQRRFLPFFLCQFSGAFNDNLFRLALIAMLSYGVFRSEHSDVLVQIATAVFMLPFFLFSAAAGDMTDRVPKRRILMATAAAKLLISVIAAASLYWQSLPLVFLCMLAMGVQSAFFGPVKFSLLPALLKKEELLNGNSWFSVSTFAAILIGTAAGTAAGKDVGAGVLLGGAIIFVSALGLLAAAAVPAPQNDVPPGQPAHFRPLASFKDVFAAATADFLILRCIIADSWFWLLGTLLLSQLPLLPYGQYINLLVSVLAGVGLGAAACRVIFRGAITTKYSPLTLLIGGALLLFIGHQFNAVAETPTLLFDGAVALFAAVMTVFVVPLRASMQARAPVDARAKIIAAYNIFNALFIVVAAFIAAVVHLVSEDGARLILLSAAIITLGTAIPAIALVPIESFRRVILAPVFRALFRVKIHGLENLQQNSVIVCNHQSLWDGIILAICLQNKERRFCFPIAREQADRFLTRQVLKLVRSYPLDPIEPQAIRSLIREVQKENADSDSPDLRPLIFPEGRITTTGGLMKIYPGAALIAEKICDGRITPIALDGLQHATLSRMQGKLRLRLFPRVSITICPPQTIIAPAHLHGEQKRDWLSHRIGAALENAVYTAKTRAAPANLTRFFADGAARAGASAPLFAELPQNRLNYRQTFARALALGNVFGARHAPQQRIGLLLPSSVGAAVCFYAALFQRLTPVMLNPSVGAAQALSACQTATLDVVYTSRRLLQRLPAAQHIADALAQQNIKVAMLEDVRPEITLGAKLKAALGAVFLQTAARRLPGAQAAPDEHAAVLFTSGSEGAPKGVALSHRNIICNCNQTTTRLAIANDDIMLNALPVFHSFGLMAGVALPVHAGTETWHYPSPLHYKAIPEIIYHLNITLFFSANTFLSNYGEAAHPADMRSLRHVFAGAEKLRPDTRAQWASKFGVGILEGYGVTETTPVIAVNSPQYHRAGSVGRVLPGIETRLVAMPDIPHGGRLLVKGDNVMAGHFLSDAPGQLRPPKDGWHDTGDIVDLDEHDYITIMGRAKRFIKTAGEMVPLDRVEEALKKRWPQAAVIGISDAKRGEVIAAMLVAANLQPDDIAAALKQDGLPDLWQPRRIKLVSELPLLSTGKTDYPAIADAFQEQE